MTGRPGASLPTFKPVTKTAAHLSLSKGRTAERRSTWTRCRSGRLRQQRPGPALEIEARVLLGLAAGDRGDALDEVEDTLRRMALLGQHGLDDLRRLGLAEAALAQEVGAILVGARDDALASRPDALR